jgi:chromosomal replication initiator protein
MASALPRPSIAAIQALVCVRLEVPLNDVLSPRRDGAVVDARHIGMWLAHREWLGSLSTKDGARYSSMAIGRKFGDRHHSTVLHAIRRIDGLIAADPEFARRIEALAAAVDQMGEEQLDA